MKTDPDLEAARFQTRIRFAELAARRGDFQATRRRLFAAGVPSDQCYCAAKALILSVRSEA
jgi:hypothetical protein